MSDQRTVRPSGDSHVTQYESGAGAIRKDALHEGRTVTAVIIGWSRLHRPLGWNGTPADQPGMSDARAIAACNAFKDIPQGVYTYELARRLSPTLPLCATCYPRDKSPA